MPKSKQTPETTIRNSQNRLNRKYTIKTILLGNGKSSLPGNIL